MESISTIYKICSASEWSEAVRIGQFAGSEADHRDGFIHFSAAHQVSETASRHFSGQSNLLLIAIDATRLGAALKWEPSRGGNLFPHLYGPLPMSAVLHSEVLTIDENGQVIIP
jgi:uncharacterized protein (DUF952 family)